MPSLRDGLEAALEGHDVRAGRQDVASCGSSSHDEQRASAWSGKTSRARASEASTAARPERSAFLRDVDGEEAVPRLELEPAELKQPTAARELDPPALPQPRRAVQQPVEMRVSREVLQGLPRLLVGRGRARHAGAALPESARERLARGDRPGRRRRRNEAPLGSARCHACRARTTPTRCASARRRSASPRSTWSPGQRLPRR